MNFSNRRDCKFRERHDKRTNRQHYRSRPPAGQSGKRVAKLNGEVALHEDVGVSGMSARILIG